MAASPFTVDIDDKELREFVKNALVYEVIE